MGFACSARMAASTTGCGVRKSGSPISRWITSWPWASTCRARVWISMTSKASMWAMRCAMRGKSARSFIAALSQVLVPELLQALSGDRERRAQFLGEERHAQLLDEPAELFQPGIAAAGFRIGLGARLEV